MRARHSPDRLYQLSTMRLALRSHQFTTPESVLLASGGQLSVLGDHSAAIVKIVRDGDPDVLRALFLPRVPFDWGVAGFPYDPGVRLLLVSRGSVMVADEQLVRLMYRIDDGGSDERAAWVALRDTLRVVAAPSAPGRPRVSPPPSGA